MSLRGVNLSALLLIVVGSALWSLTMVKSGIVYSFGMGFWGPNGHDGVWHIALINQLAQGSLDMPTFAGEALRNYHIGFDLLLAGLHKVTTIPTHTLYFQIIPPLLAILTGFLTYRFVLLWQKSHSAAFWSIFFVYFAGSFGWIVTFIRDGDIGGESMFWSQQAISTLINPPFAMSLVLILLSLILLLRIDKKPTVRDLIFAIVVFGLLVQIKAYAGVLAMAALFIVSIVQALEKRSLVFMKVFLGSLIVAIGLFLPLNKSSSGLIVFQPFWFLETMMGLSDRVGWHKFFEAMTTYRAGGIWVKAVAAYTTAFLIFFVGNMGLRLLGFYEVFKSWRGKKTDLVTLFLLTLAIFGTVLPMLFLQEGTPWNTIQFLYYSLFVFSIFAGMTLAGWLKKGRTTGILVALIAIIFAIPSTIAILRHYLPDRPPARIPQEELEALSFLKTQERGVVLTYPFDQEAAELAVSNPPRPLRLYESTAYVSAFSEKPVYLEDQVNLDITGYDWVTRRNKVQEFLSSLNHSEVYSFLRENDISYVYWVDKQRATLGESQLGIVEVFNNGKVKIYQVE